MFVALELWKNFLVCNFCQTQMEFVRKGEFKWGKLDKAKERELGVVKATKNSFNGRKCGDFEYQLISNEKQKSLFRK